jgi:radical SAM superfamily enzyme YgiQ (UPF0313 family)
LKQLAAITPECHDVETVDEKYQQIDFSKEYDIVGISCMTYNAPRGYEIADIFRRRGVTVVLGGYHPSALPEEAKQHADAVVIGEAELTWPRLLDDWKKRELKPFYRSDKLIDPHLIPPARHNIKSEKTIVESIQTSRGCPVGCEFCSIQNIEGSYYRSRPICQLIDELKSIRTKNIFFADSSLDINPGFTKNLFKEMKELDKKLASEAGCLRWLIGFESFNQDNIDGIGKKTNKVKEYRQSVRKIKEYDMLVVGMFMFGLDNDTVDVFDATVNAMVELDIDSAFFNILTPFPGTALYRRLDSEKRILSKDWSNYLTRCINRSVNFQPKYMSPSQLADGAVQAARKYYSIANIARKCCNSKNLNFPHFMYKVTSNVSSFLFYNDFIRY